jgi:hypothetical protein
MAARISQQIEKRTMRLQWLGIPLVLLVPLLADEERVVGQRNQDNFIAVSIVPESLGAVYPEGLDPDVLHWIYPGEPVVVQLTLSNNTAEPVDMARRPLEWFQAARLTLAPKSQGRGRGTAAAVQGTPVSGRLLRRDLSGRGSLGVDAVRLEAGASDRVRVEVDRSGGLTEPGVYRLSVSLDEANLPAVARQRRNILQSERLVGIRAVESRADAMNQAAHMATWARLDRDFAGARRWLSTLLSLNPRSSVAFAHLGQVARAEGNCKEAAQNWEKAIEILKVDGDPEGRDTGPVREESISSIRWQIQRCK